MNILKFIYFLYHYVSWKLYTSSYLCLSTIDLHIFNIITYFSALSYLVLLFYHDCIILSICLQRYITIFLFHRRKRIQIYTIQNTIFWGKVCNTYVHHKCEFVLVKRKNLYFILIFLFPYNYSIRNIILLTTIFIIHD